MSCCCQKVNRLCDPVSTCGGLIKSGVVAPVAGKYILRLDFLGTTYDIEKTFVESAPLNFPADKLNENYTFVGQIFNPAGQAVTMVIGEDSFDCIEFVTKLKYTISEEVEEE